MANFVPPANGASQGNYFLAKIPLEKWFRGLAHNKRIIANLTRVCVCGFFLQVKFTTSLLASLAGDKIYLVAYSVEHFMEYFNTRQIVGCY